MSPLAKQEMNQQFTVHNWPIGTESLFWAPWLRGENVQGLVRPVIGTNASVPAGMCVVVEAPRVQVSARKYGFVAYVKLDSFTSAASATKQTMSTATRPQRIGTSWPYAVELRLGDVARWEPNWDRQNAPAFSRETIQSAHQLIRQMRRFFPEDSRAGVPALVPLQDGSIRFELRTGQKELFLTALGTTVEVQKWYPLNNVQSIDYAEVPVGNVGPALEWLIA